MIKPDACPECHEGEAAGVRFADALKTILSLPPKQVNEIRADLSPAARSGVNRTPARTRGPGRSASGK